MVYKWGPDHPEYGLTVEDLFGDADPNADMSHWNRLPCWTLEETTALSFGFDPRCARWDGIVSDGHPFTQEYRTRREILRRAILTEQLPDPITPLTFKKWAKRNRFLDTDRTPPPVPKYKLPGGPGRKVRQTLLRLGKGMAVVYYGGEPAAQEIASDTGLKSGDIERFLGLADGDDDLLQPHEYDLLADFVFQLAVTAYQYDATAARSNVAGKIARELGFIVDEDTIRSRLREIAAHRTVKPNSVLLNPNSPRPNFIP